jgi:hypothetical protein
MMTESEINQEFSAKVRRGIFKPVARHLSNAATVEDRMQNAMAQTWWMYRRCIVEKGKILDDAVLVQKAKWAACDLGRSFVGAGRRRCNQDVLDPRAYRDGHVTIHRLDLLDPSEAPEGESPMEVGLAEAACPERKMNSAMDLQKWIGGLSFSDQGIMQRKMEGFGTGEVAAELDLPYLVTHRKEQQLGMELARRAAIRVDGRRQRCSRRR